MSTKIDFRPKSLTVTAKSGAPVISDPDENVFAAQQFHKLALVIDEKLPFSAKASGRLITVTGVDMTVGKTLSSLNLAIALARQGERRVLLIEADLWRPGLGQYLELHPARPGLFEVLENSDLLSTAIVNLGETGCDLLMAGKRATGEDPVCSRRMSELLVWAGTRYEFVVLDSPPLGTAAGQYLAKTSDGAAIVVGAGKTRKRSLERALQDLGPRQVVGFILNGVREDDLLEYAYPYGRIGSTHGQAKKRFRLSRRWIVAFCALLLAAAGLGLLDRFRPDLLRRLTNLVVKQEVPAGRQRAPAEEAVTPEGAATADPEVDGATAPEGESESGPGEDPSPESVSDSGAAELRRTTRRINLRTGPGTDPALLTTLPVDLRVALEDSQPGWAKIRIGDEAGWVSTVGLQTIRGSE